MGESPERGVGSAAGSSAGAVECVWKRAGQKPPLGAAVAGVLILRRREPETERPFRVPLYPLLPILFLALAIWMLISTVQYKWQATIGSVILATIIWALKPLLAKGGTSSTSSNNKPC